MQLTNEIERNTGRFAERPQSRHSARAVVAMESRKLCAYNQTRECFLGLEVTGVDLSTARLRDRLDTLAFKSGEGLWLTPFRGLPESGLRMPLDLLYLDEDHQVIDLVESFPTFQVGASSPRAESVLALPTHSIYSSQTQIGDQLVLCAAEEMEANLARLANPDPMSTPRERATTGSGVVQNAVLLREKPLWSGGPGLLELEDRSREERPSVEKLHVMGLVEPGMQTAKPPRSWLERWWSPDPRKAPREPAPGLAAYYWTGGPTEAHTIRDISTTGLYVVTEERWYPGTLVMMTLQHTECGPETAERSICVHSRAVRWGNDGVGLQFVLAKSREARQGMDRLVSAADRKELDRFLQRLRKGRK